MPKSKPKYTVEKPPRAYDLARYASVPTSVVVKYAGVMGGSSKVPLKIAFEFMAESNEIFILHYALGIDGSKESIEKARTLMNTKTQYEVYVTEERTYKEFIISRNKQLLLTTYSLEEAETAMREYYEEAVNANTPAMT